MRIGKFRKAPADRKRYEVEYTDWLNDGEEITMVTMTGNNEEDAFFVEGYTIDSSKAVVVFFVSGGVSGASYEVTIVATTSLGQVKEDTITFVVV